MASDPFYSPKRTLVRAKHHVRDFEANLAAFADGKYWTYVAQMDSQGRAAKVKKIKFDRDFFEEISCIAFDAASNLRSVLDQTAFASVLLGGNPNPKKAYFPMGGDALGLDDVIRRKCKHVPPDIISLFRGFKPYYRGNLFLPALNTLCNTQKHAALIPFRGNDLGLKYIIHGTEWFLRYEWDPENYEINISGEPVGVVISGAEVHDDGKFTFAITFSHPEPVLGGSEPLALLHGMTREVERVLMATEAECRRIGLLT
jgi:hypothetical protein